MSRQSISYRARRRKRRQRAQLLQGGTAFVLGSAVLLASAWLNHDLRPSAPGQSPPALPAQNFYAAPLVATASALEPLPEILREGRSSSRRPTSSASTATREPLVEVVPEQELARLSQAR